MLLRKLYFLLLGILVILPVAYIAYYGYSYYITPIEERFFHHAYQLLKPGGDLGHGYGVIGSLFMLMGVSGYMMRKRMRSLHRLGQVKHWLEIHIFLCTLGPFLVLFHTSFKFGGLVSISFWSMVAVFLSGIVGRFIYLQIPRTIEGRELTLTEVRDLRQNLAEIIGTSYSLDEAEYQMVFDSVQLQSGKISDEAGNIFTSWFHDRKILNKLKRKLRNSGLTRKELSEVFRLIKNEFSLNRKINRLQLMQDLFRYWHVAHLPFAIIMLVIMIIHVAVTLYFGYRWIL